MSYSYGNSYEDILNRCLSNSRLENLDKRQGSVIYDTLAPLCMELAGAYLKMDVMDTQNSLLTATGSNLDRKAYDYGMARETATKAVVTAEFKKYRIGDDGKYVVDAFGEKILEDMDVQEGSRFSLVNNSDITYVYKGKEEVVVGSETKTLKLLECESSGTGGNVVDTAILPLTQVINLVSAKILTVHTYGQNDEDDETFRTRVQNSLNNIAFGGNVSDYMEKVSALDGVASCKVYPSYTDRKHVWFSVEQTGEVDETVVTNIENAISGVTGVASVERMDFDGTVRISVVGVSEDGEAWVPMSELSMENIKEELDPTDMSGQGYGIVPIGHMVQVVTPERSTVDISLTISLGANASIGSVKTELESKLKEYMESERRKFGTLNEETNQWLILSVTRSKIVSIAQSVEGVNAVDVNSVNITSQYGDKDASGNVTYNDTDDDQYLPFLGTVTISTQ